MLRVVGILLGLFLALIGLGFFLWGLLAMGFALRQSTLADSPLIIWEMSLTITGGAFVVILSVRLMWRAIRPPLIVPLRARHKSQPADR